MSNCFVFVGDPGDDAKEKLGILESLGAVAKRVPGPGDINAIQSMEPQAIVIDGADPELGQHIVSFRERRELSQIPVIARVPSINAVSVENAFRSGCDDVCVDGNANQFRALAAVVAQREDWQTMRAPAGLVVLAHKDRYLRMRIGQVLRKNGFGLHFAGSTDELVDVVETHKPRAIIAAADLPPRSPITYVPGMEHQAPWIVLAPPEQMQILEAAVGDASNVKLLAHTSDPESLTFVLNDFLMPAQKSERRTPRILYGTPVMFKPRDGEDDDEFLGFSYNVNIGGLFVRTLTPPPMQSVLTIRFTPPMGMGTVVLTAQVVWRKEIGAEGGAATPEGMGVQFTDAMPADLAGFEAGYNALREYDERSNIAYTSVIPEKTAPQNIIQS